MMSFADRDSESYRDDLTYFVAERLARHLAKYRQITASLTPKTVPLYVNLMATVIDEEATIFQQQEERR